VGEAKHGDKHVPLHEHSWKRKTDTERTGAGLTTNGHDRTFEVMKILKLHYTDNGSILYFKTVGLSIQMVLQVLVAQ
jgi:hypothetical protein